MEQLHLPDHPARADAAQSLLRAVAEHDGVEALSEQFTVGLSDTELAHQHFVVNAGERTVAIAAVAEDSVELAVHPAYRRHHLATSLLNQVSSQCPKASAVWAHGNLPPARALAAARGWEPVRELLVMGLEGERLRRYAQNPSPDTELALFNLADALKRYPEDQLLEAWLRANNEAFSWHPEQGGWDLPRLRKAMTAEWFDPEGVLLYLQGAEDSPHVEVAGFHWTKEHGVIEGKQLGEIYVVGVADAYRGQGLGAPLIHAGIKHLVDAGAQRVILYVESDNKPAVRAYEAVGFTVAERHVVYSPRG